MTLLCLDIEFTPVLYDLNMGLISPRPRPLPPFLNLVKPFSPGVWQALAGSLAAVTFIYLTAVWVERRKQLDWSSYTFVPLKAVLCQSNLDNN